MCICLPVCLSAEYALSWYVCKKNNDCNYNNDVNDDTTTTTNSNDNNNSNNDND